MMNPIVKELIVLQVIYALIIPQIQDIDIKDSNSISTNGDGPHTTKDNTINGYNNDNSNNDNNSIINNNQNNSKINNGNNSKINNGNNSKINNGNNSTDNNPRRSPTNPDMTDNLYFYNSMIENKVISSNIKLSLVKITNEIQNSLLVNKLMDMNNEAKLTIKDILSIIRDLFPLQRTILIDGQLSFHNLKIKELKNLIIVKYNTFKEDQIRLINEYENQLLGMIPSNTQNSNGIDDNNGNVVITGGENMLQGTQTTKTTKTTTATPLSSKMTSVVSNRINAPNGSTSTVVNESPVKSTPSFLTPTPMVSSTTKSNINVRNTTPTPPSATTTTTASTTTNGTVTNKDPKREKLLQLYRDTVLNKLQSKTKILDKLYQNLDPQLSNKIVYNLLELEKIKSTTPASVHHLQLILQKSVCDGMMSSRTGSLTWQMARQVQTELEDTVQFMRRALE
ncbi:Eaf5p PWA37_000009 [Arxiozyma heterogenica]|uniref:Eaf5p n=1 Tax=Arxiozyma heterogenica TaxID=278026 RepID=UPI002F1E3DB7